MSVDMVLKCDQCAYYAWAGKDGMGPVVFSQHQYICPGHTAHLVSEYDEEWETVFPQFD